MTTQIKHLKLPVSRIRSIDLKKWVSMSFDWLYMAYERHRQRQALLKLDDHMLSDIGISRADADHEGGKPFWKE